ncbi:DUF3017 domain-containing protein [Microbispora sp. NPDC049125]|uniref:DUF3017 domain-containing protein n=1 Tax=Microbispora sp. NPDC049125 TaxID=3154929 RepID=UPI003465B0F2
MTWGPYALVAAGVLAGLGAFGLGAPPPVGGTTMGAAFIVGSLLRLWASDGRAGALAVRSRKVDAAVLAGFGAALVIGSLLLLLRLHDS